MNVYKEDIRYTKPILYANNQWDSDVYLQRYYHFKMVQDVKTDTFWNKV